MYQNTSEKEMSPFYPPSIFTQKELKRTTRRKLLGLPMPLYLIVPCVSLWFLLFFSYWGLVLVHRVWMIDCWERGNSCAQVGSVFWSSCCGWICWGVVGVQLTTTKSGKIWSEWGLDIGCSLVHMACSDMQQQWMSVTFFLCLFLISKTHPYPQKDMCSAPYPLSSI